MPEQKNDRVAASFDDLTAMQLGCLDCIIYCETNGDDADDWQGIGRDDFDPEALSRIVADCDRFLGEICLGDAEFEDRLFADVDATDFGWQFHLERQGTGQGFAELHISQPLLSRLIMNAIVLRRIEFAVTQGKVNVVGSLGGVKEMRDNPSLSYDDLDEFQQGYADALVEFESGLAEEEWYGVSVHDFSDSAIAKIIEDCTEFAKAMGGDEPGNLDPMIEDVSDYDLGWYLYLDRRGSGLGLSDLLHDGDLLKRASLASDDLGNLTVEVGQAGDIRIYSHGSWDASPAR